MKAGLHTVLFSVWAGSAAWSCAAAGDTSSVTPTESTPIPSGLADASGDGGDGADGADGSCETDGLPCTPAPLTCDDADYCPVDVPIGRSYSLLSLWGTSADNVWAVGTGGAILHWAGAKWDLIPSDTQVTLRGVSGSGRNDVWFVSGRDTIFHGLGLENGSMSWAPRPPAVAASYLGNEQPILHAVWSGAPGDVWIGGALMGNTEGAPAVQWRAGANDAGWVPSFRIRNAPSDAGYQVQDNYIAPTIFGITAVGEERWAVGGTRRKYSGTEDTPLGPYAVGQAFRAEVTASPLEPLVWEEFDTQANSDLRSVWGTPAAGVWTVGDSGTIRHYATGAVRWDIVPAPTKEDLLSVWGTGPDDIWAVGTNMTILHYDGVEWTPRTVAFDPKFRFSLHAVWGSGRDDVWVAGENVLLHFTGRKSALDAATP